MAKQNTAYLKLVESIIEQAGAQNLYRSRDEITFEIPLLRKNGRYFRTYISVPISCYISETSYVLEGTEQISITFSFIVDKLDVIDEDSAMYDRHGRQLTEPTGRIDNRQSQFKYLIAASAIIAAVNDLFDIVSLVVDNVKFKPHEFIEAVSDIAMGSPSVLTSYYQEDGSVYGELSAGEFEKKFVVNVNSDFNQDMKTRILEELDYVTSEYKNNFKPIFDIINKYTT